MPNLNSEDTVAVNARVFEDNFNALSHIINNYPAANYTEGLDESEDASLSASNSQVHQKPALTNKFKYYLLAFFSCIYLIYGCQNSLLGSAMQDLTKILNTTSESISFAVSTKNLMFSVSTILASFSFKIFGNRQMQYGGAVFAVGIITGLTPFMTSFTQYLVGAIISGLSSAFVDSVTNLIVLELFSLNSKIYMQIAHTSFTFGTIFGPLLVGPFLDKNSTIPSNSTDSNYTGSTTTLEQISTTPLPTDLNETTTINKIQGLSYMNYKNGTNDNHEFNTRIYIPYLIISFLLMLSAISMVISQIVYPYFPEKRKLFAKQKSKRTVEPLEEQIEESANSTVTSQSSSANQSSSSNKRAKVETVCQQIRLPKIYYFTFLGLTGLLLSIYTCIDGLTGLFLPSFLSKGELKIPKDDAAFMASIVNMSMAVGRVFTIIFALKMTCKVLLFFNLTMIFSGYMILTFFAVHSIVITWIAMFVIGSGLSSTYPLVLSYIENRIVITNTVQLYLLFASVVFLIFIPILVGHFIDTAPMVFAYINLFFAISALILMLLIHISDVWKRRLIKKIKEDEDNLVVDED